MTKRVLCFFGTRPEAIKMAPVIARLKSDRRFRVLVAVSAQHRSMLDQVLKIFGLRADIDLNLMREGQSLFDVTARVLRGFERVLGRLRPDLVLVHGDTTTTMAGALAAYYQKIPVGHVEAGLRTHDMYRPYPEEINRRLTDGLSTLFFAPTEESRQNLRKENIPERAIFVTGNTVIDALFETVRKAAGGGSFVGKLVRSIREKGRRIILLTAHRRENFNRPFSEICRAVRNLSFRYPQVHWVYPVHLNPHVRGPARRLLKGRPNIHLIDPVDYSDLVHLMKASALVVTDSGGIQEEAPSLGKPVLVLREVTERPEAVRAGTVRIVGTSTNKIIREVTRLLDDGKHYQRMANAVNPYGDGRASERILQAVQWYFGFRRRKPTPFGGRR